MHVRYLTEEEATAINIYVIRKYSPNEDEGVKVPELLNSAIHRPKHSAFNQDAYPTIFEKASALFQSLAQNHPFYNANKRTALLSLLQFLHYNGYNFTMTPKQAEDFTVDVVNHTYTFDEIVATIKEYSLEL